MRNVLIKYFRIWWLMTIKATNIAFTSRFGAFIFLIGKLLRFGFFILFLMLIGSKTNLLAGFTLSQMIFFFLTFNLVDTLAQFFLREVYRFRWYVVSGDFDYILTKPISPLFRSLFGGSDILDLFILLISIVFIIVTAGNLGEITFFSSILYILLIINAFLIALSFHILVLAVGILTTEVDNAIMFYRDLTIMGRVPVDIYREPLRGFITFIIPIGIMMTFPAKALFGILSWEFIFISFILSAIFIYLSTTFWKYSLTRYTSASS